MTRRLLLPVRRPYDFKRSVHSYGYWELPPFRWDQGSETLQRAERVNGRVYLLEFCRGPHRSRTESTVAVEITGDAIDQEIERELVARSRAMLRLDEDLTEFYAVCRRVSWLATIPRLGVGRLMRGSSLWEDVVKAVSWTNTTWTQAVKMVSRLAALGDPCPDAPGLRAWPTPIELLDAGLPFLQREAKLGYRAQYLIDLAREVEAGKIDLVDLDKRARALDSSRLARELMTIKGVGPASAAYLLSMLGHYDHLIVDSATRAFIARRFFKGRTPGRNEIGRPFVELRQWRGLGLWFGFWLSWKSGTRR